MGIQRLNKKGIVFKNAFFAVIVVSMFVLAMSSSLNTWNDRYNSGLTVDLDDYDKLDDISSTAGNQESVITPSETDPSTDFEGNTFRGGFGIIGNIYEPFRIIFGDNGMIDSVTERIGLPDYVRQGLVAMMVIAITFGIVAILFRISGGRV